MKRILLLSSLFLAAGGVTSSHVHAKTAYNTIAEHLLKSLDSKNKKSDEGLTEYEKYSTALSILHRHARITNDTRKILHDSTIHDLQLFFHDVTKPNFTVLNHTKRTQTTLGTCALARLLITPCTSYDDISARRELVSELIDNDELRHECEALLKKFAAIEPHLLNMWNPNDILYSDNMSETFFRGAASKLIQLPSGKAVFVDDLWNVTSLFAGPLVINLAKRIMSQAPSAPSSGESHWMIKKLGRARDAVGTALEKVGKPFPSWAPEAAAFGLTLLMSGTNTWNYLRNKAHLMNIIKYRLSYFGDLKKISHSIRQTAQGYALNTLAPFLDDLDELTSGTGHLRRFLSLTSSKAFARKGAYTSPKVSHVLRYLISNRSAPLTAFSSFKQMRDAFCAPLNAIAQLDAYVSIAKLYKEHESAEHGYCFPEYMYEAKRPYLKLTKIWHPMLPPSKAVSSSVHLGRDRPQNVVLTGPNAGGKSTNLKAVILSTLFAQTLTIAPGTAVTLTPFSVINTYLNVIDDIGSGYSQHRAEVVRARELIESIVNLRTNEFALTTMDEMFRSTVPATGAAASLAVAKGLSEIPNSMLLLATHFGKLITLPEKTNNAFANYKVTARKNEDGSFTYPFNLQEGFNQKVIALDLLSYEGFNPDILSYAYDHLKDVDKQRDSDSNVPSDSQISEFIQKLQERIEKEIEKKKI